MADLPDLDTTSIEFIAYWNAIDQGGVDAIEPEEVLTDGNISAYAIYDNGVEGTYNSTTGRTITFRVKNDGWFVTYFDRTENFDIDVTDQTTIRGPWDISNNWTDSGHDTITRNTLERAISSLQNQLPNSGDIGYNDADVGLYNYNRSTATTITLLSHRGSNDASFSYTSATDRIWHVIAAKARRKRGDDGHVEAPSGTRIVDSNNGNTTKYGAYDMLANVETPEPATEYTIGHREQKYDARTTHANLIMWK